MHQPIRRPLLGMIVLTLLLSSVGAMPALAAEPSKPVGGERLANPGIVTARPRGVPPPPAVVALSYVLADLDTGEILASKGAHRRLRPASTQKILTAVTLLPKLDPKHVYTATWEDANVEGSKVGIVPDGTYSVHNLFEALFLRSGNDAANALANVNGGVAKTVDDMNARARELGALDTTVANPSGLDADGQFSSAYDLALLGREGMKREDFRAYAMTVKSQFPGKMVPAGHRRPKFEIYTTDRLLLNYEGAVGIKNGFTSLARNTFVGAAKRGQRALVVSVMHSGPHVWKEAAALLTWGFANAHRIGSVGTLQEPMLDQSAAPKQAPDQGGDQVLAAPIPVSGDSPPNPFTVVAWLVTVLVGSAVMLRARVLLLRRSRQRLRLPRP